MKTLTLCVCLLLTTSAAAQHHVSNYPQPPAPADAGNTVNSTPATTPPIHMDPIELQREAKELLELSQSIQPDIANISRGLLPKDTLDKLKRIEKLAKHLRSELSR
jgi:Skp family chaperone for outer membrane proteins